MLTFFDRKLFPLTAGICLAAAVMSGDQAALAANVQTVSSAASGTPAENLLLAQIGQPPQGTTSPSPIPGAAVRRVPLPVKIPEPSTVVGLGLVAGSLAVSRRSRWKN